MRCPDGNGCSGVGVGSFDTRQDLRCAAVVSLLAPAIGDGEKKAGVAAGLAYFIGRWEVATGRRFEEALTTDFLMDTNANMQSYNKECGTRLMSLGQRMQEWGKALQASVKNPE